MVSRASLKVKSWTCMATFSSRTAFFSCRSKNMRKPSLARVPGVHDRCFQRGERLARGKFPDDDVADLIPGGDMGAVRRDGTGIEHGREVVRRHLLVAPQLANQLTAHGIPEPAHHIV